MRIVSTSPAPPRNCALFVQYTNPAAYPPLEHASRILANQGWRVVFLAAAVDNDDGRRFSDHERIEVRRLPKSGDGLIQHLNYVAYMAWVAVETLRLRPTWIYASDHLSCPATVLAQRLSGCKVVYHEHDTPPDREHPSLVQRAVIASRRRLANRAEIGILPQEQRLRLFIEQTRRKGPTLCVHNSPRRDEVARPRSVTAPVGPTTFYYHGSINKDRLPFSVLDAMSQTPPNTRLVVVGYETLGSIGYIRSFMERAASLGLGERVKYLGVMSRRDVMAAAVEGNVGLAFMPLTSSDLNMQHMAGASNKPFDYMAVGMMLLVSDLPEWRKMFVEPGYAKACDPANIAQLADTMIWCAANPDAVRAMGEQGRQKIERTWNYEKEFAPVLRILNNERCEK